MDVEFVRRTSARAKEWIPFVVAVTFLLSANLTANAWSAGSFGLISVVFYLGSGALLYSQRHKFFRPRTRSLRTELAEKREHLVLFLSKLELKGALDPVTGIPRGVALSGNLDQDLATLDHLKDRDPPIRWPWEMPLRGISHHIDKLKSVTIIASVESAPQLPLFRKVLERYLDPSKVRILALANENRQAMLRECPSDANSTVAGWNFEDFDQLTQAVLRLVELYKRGLPLDGKSTAGSGLSAGFCGPQISEGEIMIDLTGGQKVTSIVAAAVTINRPLKAQYVQTERPYQPLSYDIELSSMDPNPLA